MKKREIVNSTVYRTEDVVKILEACNKQTSSYYKIADGAPIKIRYMNNVLTTYVRHTSGAQAEERYVDVRRNRYNKKPFEVTIVRPSKVKVSALHALAQVADVDKDEVLKAPSVLKTHLVVALHGCFNSYDKDSLEKMRTSCKTMTIRQDDKAKDRKAYTLTNLKGRVQSKKNSIAQAAKDIAKHKRELKWSEERHKRLKKELPPLEKKVKAFK